MSRGPTLVLGAGFIGGAVARSLADHGHQVTVLTRSAPAQERAHQLIGCEVRQGDLASFEHLDALVSRFDHVVFALGSGSPVASARAPAAQVTAELLPLVDLLESLRRTTRADLTYLSSGGAVYGNCGDLPIREDAPTRPVSGYGVVKLACEQYLRIYAADHGVRSRVLRVANAYGPGQRWDGGQGMVARLLHSVQHRQTVPVFGEGRSVRDYVFIDDVAEAVARLLRRDEPFETFNVGSGTGQSILTLVQHINRVTGIVVHLEFREPRPFDVDAIVLDCDSLDAAVGLRGRDVVEGLDLTWKSSRALDRDAAVARSV